MLDIGYLASGDLGLSTLLSIEKLFVPSFIATNNLSSGIIKYATKRNIPLFTGNPRNGKLCDFLTNNTFDLLLSVNYLFILDKDILELAKYAVNIHGSLLPKYRGRAPHIWAIINNENKTGVTAHFIDSGCDTGDIIVQKIVEIEKDDTGANLLNKFESIYPKIAIEIIEKAKTNTLSGIKQNELLASFFNKRTPADGLINWNWQRERIKNWVRAQAYPYPGSFTFINNRKFIIDKISFSDLGFNQNQQNGLILKSTPNILVKTPNGVIQIESFRFDHNDIVQGNIFIP